MRSHDLCSLVEHSRSGTASSRLGKEHLEAAAAAGRGEVRAGRGGAVVESMAAAFLINLAESKGLHTSGGWKCDKLNAFLSAGSQSREPMGKLKSWQEHKKVLF